MNQATQTQTQTQVSRIKLRSFQIGSIHPTNYGDARIIARLPREQGKAQELSIQFLETGYICTVFLTNLRSGKVIDAIRILNDSAKYPRAFHSLKQRITALLGAGVLAEFLPTTLRPALGV